MKLMYTTDEAARLLRVDRKTLLRSIARSEVRVTRIGRAVRIPAREMCKLLGLDEGTDIDECHYPQTN